MDKMYKIKFPIGDWSDDGHGKCETFIVESNRDVSEVREAHFACKERLGFEIGDICHKYGDSDIKSDLSQKLNKLGILDGIVFDMEQDFEKGIYLSPDEMVQIWLAILMHISPSMKLRIVDDDIPYINFYGVDGAKRHLSTPGYGLFE